VSKKNALGRAHGFKDVTQGTLFFDIARIIDEKRPGIFLLENVRNLQSHDKGQTFRTIIDTLSGELGYHITYRVMDARCWVPQGRQRILIVGFDGERGADPGFTFDMVRNPDAGIPPVMGDILHPEDGSEEADGRYTVGRDARVNPRYILTNHLWQYLRNYAAKHKAAGNGFGYGLVGPDDVARTLSARYHKDGSEILVSRGARSRPRRLTPRECARLMGFPDDFVIPVSDTQAYRQFGNSVVAKMVADVALALRPYIIEYSREPLAAA
jgi:DNA (cytosine-5)-methyltransferase 1